jgi:segregation and condensation protein A
MLRAMLLRQGQATFRSLSSDCQGTLEVVARFLALLELYREGVLSFEQVEALGELHVRWIGGDDEDTAGTEIDEYGDDDEDPEEQEEQEQPADGQEAAAEAGEGTT